MTTSPEPGPARGTSRRRPETHEPGERSKLPRTRLVVAYALAVALPTLVAVAMIPVRVDHGRAAAIVLVVPVVLTASLGALGPAITAAVSASIAYDVFLTAPYLHLVIDDPDDVVAAITLAVVGLVVGVMSSRLARIAARDTARRSELRHLLRFAEATTRRHGSDELTQLARSSLTALLDLRDCRWSAEPGGIGRRPQLLPDGNVMGYESSLNPDRATLPAEIELVATSGGAALGSFILTPRPGHATSHEERLTAATIAALYAGAIARQAPPPTPPADRP